MDFQISGLPIEDFAHLLQLGDAELRRAGVTPCIVDAPDSYPCRVTLEDAVPGEEVLLLTHAHQPAPGPYASSGPIFVRRNATATRIAVNHVPAQQRRRMLSVRAYDQRHWLVDGGLTPGTDLESLIERFFARPDVHYLQVHSASYGCYSCRVDRVPAGTTDAAHNAR